MVKGDNKMLKWKEKMLNHTNCPALDLSRMLKVGMRLQRKGQFDHPRKEKATDAQKDSMKQYDKIWQACLQGHLIQMILIWKNS